MPYGSLWKYFSYLWPVKVKTLTTAKGQHLEIGYEGGRKVLNTTRANYSFGSLHKVFDQTFRTLDISSLHPRSILLLGLGAGSILQLLRQTYHIESPVTAVEFDEDIIEIAREQFGISKYHNVTIVCDDAFAFMARQQQTFDLIIDDIYLDIVMPDQSLQKNYLEQIVRSLNPSGLFIKNCMFTDTAQKTTFDTELMRCFSGHSIINAGKLNHVYACFCKPL